MKFTFLNIPCWLLAIVLVQSEGFAQDEKSESKKTEKVVQEKTSQPSDDKKKEVETPHQGCVLSSLEMKDICGKHVKLDKYKGKVVLVVNVASKCGFTGQYRPLQQLHEKFHEHGLEVIAFPCSQFGGQEFDDNEKINHFCKKKFGIDFDIFAKVDVKGEKQAELFKRLTSKKLAPAGKGDIKWNFEKFIIGKDGKPVARFRSNVHPDADVVVEKLKTTLGIEEVNKKKSDKSGKQSTKSSTSKKTSSGKQ